MTIVKELKEFMMRGNVVDMAVGIIIGGAFGKIVTSLVNDVIMPPIGMLLNGVNFKDLKWVLKAASTDAQGVALPEVSLNYGNFIQVVVDFIIISTAIFFLIKAINSIRTKSEQEPKAPPAPTKEEKLLAEIRDILKNKQPL